MYILHWPAVFNALKEKHCTTNSKNLVRVIKQSHLSKKKWGGNTKVKFENYMKNYLGVNFLLYLKNYMKNYFVIFIRVIFIFISFLY